jgi:hypothetical protein
VPSRFLRSNPRRKIECGQACGVDAPPPRAVMGQAYKHGRFRELRLAIS